MTILTVFDYGIGQNVNKSSWFSSEKNDIKYIKYIGAFFILKSMITNIVFIISSNSNQEFMGLSGRTQFIKSKALDELKLNDLRNRKITKIH